MTNKFSLFLFLASFLIFAGCSLHHKNLSIEQINQMYSQIDPSDGLNKQEIILTAQHFLLTTKEEKCRDVDQFDLNKAVLRGGDDAVQYVGFKRKGFRPFSNRLYVFVGLRNGKLKCSGEMFFQ